MTEAELTPQQVDAALREINPPHDADVQKYLGQQLCQEFCRALGGAVRAYIDGGKGCPFGDWRLDRRALRYEVLVDEITAAKQAEGQRRQAESECDQFVNAVHAGIRRFKEELAQEKKPELAYPPALAKYHPPSWCSLKPPTQEEITKWARPHIQKKVPHELAGFVSWKLTVEAIALPRATYEVRGVPCLNWQFIIPVLVRVHAELVGKISTRAFCGFEYKLAMGAEELGDLYLGPVAWDRQEGFTTPITLLAILARGEVEGGGIQLTKKDGSSITFLVPGYDGEVTVSTRFRQFIVGVSAGNTLASGLLGAGVIDALVARLLQDKMAALSPPPTAGVQCVNASGGKGDLEAALEGMGYSQKEIEEMIKGANLPPWMPIEDRVKAILKATQA